MTDGAREQCHYCGSEVLGGTQPYPLQDHERKARESKGLIPLEEPVTLCDFCYTCAHRITSAMIYNHEQRPATTSEIEQALSRWFNRMMDRAGL